MLASFCPGGAMGGFDGDTESSGSGECEEGAAAMIIGDLLGQGAQINAQADRTGKL